MKSITISIKSSFYHLLIIFERTVNRKQFK